MLCKITSVSIISLCVWTYPRIGDVCIGSFTWWKGNLDDLKSISIHGGEVSFDITLVWRSWSSLSQFMTEDWFWQHFFNAINIMLRSCLTWGNAESKPLTTAKWCMGHLQKEVSHTLSLDQVTTFWNVISDMLTPRGNPRKGNVTCLRQDFPPYKA